MFQGSILDREVVVEFLNSLMLSFALYESKWTFCYFECWESFEKWIIQSDWLYYFYFCCIR